MNPNLDLRNAVVIYELPHDLIKAGMEALAKSISISLKSIIPMRPDNWGVNLSLDSDFNFRKIVSKGFLEVSKKIYSVYPVVTELTVCGVDLSVDQVAVKYLLEPFAPVLIVYPEKTECERKLKKNYRAALLHPEIPEKIKKWTCIKMTSLAIDNTELSVTFFCRFCRQYGHTRHECNKRKLQDLLNAATQDSSVTSNSNAKGHMNACMSPGNNSIPNSFLKTSKNSETNQKERKNYPQNNETEVRLSEKTSMHSYSFRFIKLIPPSLKTDIVHLKKFILDYFQEQSYTTALRYPEGINKLIHVLEHMVRFNEKYSERRSEEEKKFNEWLHLVVTKIKYLHLQTISKLEPQYKPPMEEIIKSRIEYIRTNPQQIKVTRKEHHTEKKNQINPPTKTNSKFSNILKALASEIKNQSQDDKYVHSKVTAEYKSDLSKINRSPIQQNNIPISDTYCKNTKPVCQSDEGNKPKCSSSVKSAKREVATKREYTQPQTIKQNKPFSAEFKKPEVILIDHIIHNKQLTHSRNARQTEMRVQSPINTSLRAQNNDQRTVLSKNEKADLRINVSKHDIHSKPNDELDSTIPKSELCCMIKNFPVVVKREPDESLIEHAIPQKTCDEKSRGSLKKKVKTEFSIEKTERDIKNVATLTGNTFFSL
ncbi:hypothetical protein NPIL_482091 [Nephila pilipes]|uniref:Uncharacterized protein n=1 Tax=Nephila pilipes TaxID=299642 RepID=A0A8X6IIV0_NEPPI|nr:hypothetical protein NPIL_482091 [Nephila pilipes]